MNNQLGSIDLNPNQDEFAKTIYNINSRLTDIEKSRQPYLGAWKQIIFTSAMISSPTNIANISLIEFVGFKPSRYLRVGSIIRVKQGGDYLYFNVIRVGQTLDTIDVLGDSDFPLINGTLLTDFAYSNDKTAEGFPEVMKFVPVWTKVTGAGTISFSSDPTDNLAVYRMDGNKITVWVTTFLINYTGADKLAVTATLPLYSLGYGDLNDDGVVDATDFSLALNDTSTRENTLFQTILLNSYYPLKYTDVASTPYLRDAYGAIQYTYSNVPAKYYIECLDNTTGDAVLRTIGFSFKTEFVFKTVGETRVGYLI